MTAECANCGTLLQDYAKLLVEYRRLFKDYQKSETDVLHNLQAAQAVITKEQVEDRQKLVLRAFVAEAEAQRWRNAVAQVRARYPDSDWPCGVRASAARALCDEIVRLATETEA